MAKTPTRSRKPTTPAPSADERTQLIAVEAYLLAEQRAFAPGGELADWLAAEQIVDARLSGTR